MITRIRAWWKHLGYAWNSTSPSGKFRTFGLRPWRGAPFFWFVIDSSNTAVQSAEHVSACEECRVNEVPVPKRSEEHGR